VRTLAITLALVLGWAAATPVAAAQDNPPPPVVTTGGAIDVGQSSATVTGTVDPNGASTTYYGEYGTTTGYGLRATDRDAGAGDAPVEVRVTLERLTADTTYHYRIVAANAAGITRGGDRTLRTLAPPSPPDAGTGSVRSVGSSSAVLTGTVFPRGLAGSYNFEYGRSSSRLTARTPETAFGPASRVAASAAVGELAASTRYYYRLVARTAAGTDRGGVRSFTTLRGPSGVTIVASPEPVVFGGFVTISGRVAGGGTAGITVALERHPFPFSPPPFVAGEQRADRDGSFRFVAGPLFGATRFRVVTRNRLPVASPVFTVRNRVRVGLIARRLRGRRLRLYGSISPQAAPSWRVTLQKQSPTGRWVRLKRLRPRPLRGGRSRYRTVAFLRRQGRPAAYRVVVTPRDAGAHVRGYSRAVVLTRP
jgi:hypothetical protein